MRIVKIAQWCQALEKCQIVLGLRLRRRGQMFISIRSQTPFFGYLPHSQLTGSKGVSGEVK